MRDTNHRPARTPRGFLLLCALPVLALCACYATGRPPSPPSSGATAGADSREWVPAARSERVPAIRPEGIPTERRFTAGRSVEKRPIDCIEIGSGKETVFFLASIHGDEPAGTPLLHRLAEYLRRHPQARQGHRVLLLPEANPDGMARESRCNARGVDLNRNFAAANRTATRRHGVSALSEPEATVIERLILQYAPRCIVSIHQPLDCVDYDGPAKDLAFDMAKLCRLPVRKLGTRPGSLGAWAGEDLGIPIITIELPSDASQLAPDELWDRFGTALLAAIVHEASADRDDPNDS